MRLLAASILLGLTIMLVAGAIAQGESVVKIRVYDFQGEPAPEISYIVIVRGEGGKSYILEQGKSDSSGLIEFSISDENLMSNPDVIFYKGTIEVGSIGLYFPKTEYEAYLDLFDVEVTVVEDDGDPVDHATVRGYWEEIYGRVEVSGVTSPEGEPAVLEDVPPISLYVEAYKLGVKIGEIDAAVDAANYKLTISAGKMADLTVRVVDAAGNPVVGAATYIARESGVPLIVEATNSSGYAVFTGLPSGFYYVGATFQGLIVESEVNVGEEDIYEELTLGVVVEGTVGTATLQHTQVAPASPQSKPSTHTRPEQQSTTTREALKGSTVEIVLPPEAVSPRETVTVVVISGPEGIPIETTTGGLTVTVSLPPGHYTLKVYRERGEAIEGTVEVPPGQSGVVVRLQPGGATLLERLLLPIMVSTAIILAILAVALLVRRRGREG